MPVTVRPTTIQPMLRLVLGGDQLEAFERDGLELPGFVSLGFDDHVKIFFPDPVTGRHVLPTQLERRIEWSDDPAPISRSYTVRAFVEIRWLHRDPAAGGRDPRDGPVAGRGVRLGGRGDDDAAPHPGAPARGARVAARAAGHHRVLAAPYARSDGAARGRDAPRRARGARGPARPLRDPRGRDTRDRGRPGGGPGPARSPGVGVRCRSRSAGQAPALPLGARPRPGRPGRVRADGGRARRSPARTPRRTTCDCRSRGST